MMPPCDCLQANTSPEFCTFLTLKLDEAAKERRARAMAEARRGLHMASEPDSDAISVPDNNFPDMPGGALAIL